LPTTQIIGSYGVLSSGILFAISLLYGMSFVYARLAAEGRQSSRQIEGRVHRGLALTAMCCLTTERPTPDQLELNRSTLTRRTCAIGSYMACCSGTVTSTCPWSPLSFVANVSTLRLGSIMTSWNTKISPVRTCRIVKCRDCIVF
jgi:hypothetical protein